MAAPLKQAQHRTYDDAKLAAMTEPLTVRIEKRKGSSRTPIPMPPSEDGRPQGTGFTKDEIRQLESWLVNEWAGGGYYEITVTDSTVPTPLIMKWEPYWAPAEFPEKTPPPIAEAAAAHAANRPATVSSPLPKPLQVVPTMSQTPAFPGGFPPGLPPQPAAAAPAPTPYYAGHNPYYSGYGGAYGAQQQQQAWQAEAERRRTEDERRRAEEERRQWEEQMRKTQAELQAAKEAAMRRDYEAQLERERAASNERVKAVETQMAELRNMITGLATTIQTGVQKNPELEALREQNRQTAERLEREQREREAERRDAALRDMIKAQQDQSRQQIEVLQRQFETQMQALSRAAENRGPDPAFSMMKEIIAQNNQSLKDLSHQNSLQFERMQSMMMKPQDLMLLTKESQGSVDQITERMTRYFGNVIDMQSRVMEQALQMQPQGSGAVDMVRDGLTQVKELAERYVGMKQTQAQVAAQAQVEMTQAQVEAMRIQADAELRAKQPQPQVVYAPPPPRAEAQLAGPSVNGTNGKRKKQNGMAQPTGPIDTTKRLGRTDLDWFGPLLAEVLQLRDGVTKYIETLQAAAQDPSKQIEGIPVEQTAAGIVQAMQMVAQAGVPVPAMVDLLSQQRYADFMDVLLPNAPQAYRDDVVTVLVEQLKQVGITKPAVPGVAAAANDDADDADDADVDDDGDPDSDDDNDGKVTPLPTAKNGRKPPRARA